jgi:tetratricopeptide (TPR) repeat protein
MVFTVLYAVTLFAVLHAPQLNTKKKIRGLLHPWANAHGVTPYVIKNYQEALRIALRLQNRSLKAKALIGLGNVYNAQDDFKATYFHFSGALKIAPTQQLRQKARNGMERAESFLRSNRI